MNDNLSSNLISLLNECSEHIENKEYAQWCNSSSVRSFEEYRSKHTQDLLTRVQRAITDIAQT